MSDPSRGGKTYKKWVEQLKSGDARQKGMAVCVLRELILDEEDLDEGVVHQIARAIAEATHDDDTSVRVRSYGAVGQIAKILAYDLLHEQNPQKPAVTLRRMMTESNALHLVLLQIAPDLIQHLRKEAMLSSADKKATEQAIIEKLEKEKKENKRYPAHCQAAEEALKKIAAM
jgi:hypothetical protein